ncbi:MHS family proline/betaine transporter-like MFS transporter [Amycolatopsis bartoniae]|uniref:MFS transporter n=1 Tax=Amycolatopsis bartoniae TaxID=941986 RepID=A0A8H9M757_9PSEU|nr:MFS transporter [Amycolatopsis bartoniae]MBB2938410.1 MHS family proline/betaine transporter-like MFS transporter [Amycolatopsis bartoniae]TVT06096.1 MHS family MFS transporter [Amycolatopsis bartoniae]GHF71226.1 MFS transporter [Amycolatopsis bartoniae]
METTSLSAGAAAPAFSPRLTRRAALAGGVGTLIEYYDFSVYGFLTVTIAPLFFPNANSTASMLSALAVFASGYLVRPLGGIFFGWLGDRSGRRVPLVATVLGMGVCSGLLGALPTFASAGVLAPLLLVVLRLAGGFCAGGEIGGAATYIAESTPPRRRGFFGSFTPFGSTFGFAVAAMVVGIVSSAATSASMSSWAWRLPFLLCLPLAVLCLLARARLEDTPEFTRQVAEGGQAKRPPLLEVLRTRPLSVLRVIGLAVATNGTGYIGLTYVSVYLIKTLHFPANQVYWLSAAVIALACLTMPLTGLLSDRWGRRKVLVTGLVGYLVVAYPVLAVMGGAGNLFVIGLVYLVYMVLNGFLQVPAFPLFTELFPGRIRYTGVALGFNLGTILAGGTAPYVATLLVAKTGDHESPAFWVIGVAVVGLISLVGLRETANTRLPQ